MYTCVNCKVSIISLSKFLLLLQLIVCKLNENKNINKSNNGGIC